MEKMTELCQAQITRLITHYGQSGEVRAKRSPRRRSPTVYTPEDIVLPASVDEAQETRRPATQEILLRELYDFNAPRFCRLAGISVAQIYCLRQPRVPETAGGLSRHTRRAGGHRRAAGATTRGSAWILAGGHCTPRRSGRGGGSLVSATSQISEAALPSRAKGHAAAVSFRILEVSLRHWQ
jgi:hypothetical protein